MNAKSQEAADCFLSDVKGDSQVHAGGHACVLVMRYCAEKFNNNLMRLQLLLLCVIANDAKFERIPSTSSKLTVHALLNH